MTITLLDLAIRNGSDAVAGLIDETVKLHPELSGRVMFLGEERTIPNVGDGRTIRGTQYKTLVRTANPTVTFRNVNEGVAGTKGTHENRIVETFPLTPRWHADKAIADRHEDGPEALMAEEASAHMEAAMQRLAKNFYYGRDSTFGDTKGFPGLLAAYDATNKVVDAGGTTASIASSVWLVKWGVKDVRWVWGNNGMLELSDVDLREVSDGTNNYTAYLQELYAYAGLQVGSTRSIVRIKKLTTDSGKGLTDDLIAQALEKFEAGVVPDVIFASRRSLRQLRASRTATNVTGSPAPFPTEAFGVPIAVTDGIVDTEELAL